MTNAFETMEQRDRASGWKHAKLSSHTKELRRAGIFYSLCFRLII